MKTYRRKISLLIVSIFLISIIYHSLGSPLGLSNEIITINEKTDYGLHLDDALGDGGQFQLVLHLLDTSKTAILFSYEVSALVLIPKNDNINHTVDISINSVNGTLEPGNSIQIIHQIIDCVNDQGIAFYFEFSPVLNSTAELSIDIVIEDYGEDTCPGQLEPNFLPNLPNLPIYILIIIFVSIIIVISILYINSLKSKSNNDEDKDKLYPT